MNAKTYLGQAYRMNLRINNQLEQLEQLKALTSKITSSFGKERVSCTKEKSPMENAIIKIVVAEDEINRTIDRFIDLKVEISSNIQKLDNFENRILLELRYLCFNTWEEIAAKMNYRTSYIYKIHNRALKAMEKVMLGGKV
ncbi:DUF1492 domain-containing protein [Ruminiclostridium papyrosolvens]|uniref:DUF1492 domain-containing protein n=1 Tax=Ruminiclostridium papyrosolvens C7 TaxID=1330534 RepID=U4QX19_9FIRM|nr:DUF1492 domain-containing protein [Ruminiclostridium papyrosolvens]EPR08121.1 hypothetical protein L323_18555 [Ruminiclostridium papyrosolvens C7]